MAASCYSTRLASFPPIYGLADVAFVGGSLVPKGGHNIIEPARHGVAIVVGNHTDNFRDIIWLFQTQDAVRIVGPAELPLVLMELISNDAERKALGRPRRRDPALAGRGDREDARRARAACWLPAEAAASAAKIVSLLSATLRIGGSRAQRALRPWDFSGPALAGSGHQRRQSFRWWIGQDSFRHSARGTSQSAWRQVRRACRGDTAAHPAGCSW